MYIKKNIIKFKKYRYLLVFSAIPFLQFLNASDVIIRRDELAAASSSTELPESPRILLESAQNQELIRDMLEILRDSVDFSDSYPIVAKAAPVSYREPNPENPKNQSDAQIQASKSIQNRMSTCSIYDLKYSENLVAIAKKFGNQPIDGIESPLDQQNYSLVKRKGEEVLDNIKAFKEKYKILFDEPLNQFGKNLQPEFKKELCSYYLIKYYYEYFDSYIESYLSLNYFKEFNLDDNLIDSFRRKFQNEILLKKTQLNQLERNLMFFDQIGNKPLKSFNIDFDIIKGILIDFTIDPLEGYFHELFNTEQDDDNSWLGVLFHKKEKKEREKEKSWFGIILGGLCEIQEAADVSKMQAAIDKTKQDFISFKKDVDEKIKNNIIRDKPMPNVLLEFVNKLENGIDLLNIFTEIFEISFEISEIKNNDPVLEGSQELEDRIKNIRESL